MLQIEVKVVWIPGSSPSGWAKEELPGWGLGWGRDGGILVASLTVGIVP